MAYLNISLSPMSKRVCVCVCILIYPVSRRIWTAVPFLQNWFLWNVWSHERIFLPRYISVNCWLLFIRLLFEYDGCLLAGVLSEASDTGTRSSSTDFISDARWKIEFWRYETENELFWYILFFEFDLWGNYSRYER